MPIEYMDVEEFLNEGYLHEVNRRFFHPLGLALVIRCETDDETGEPTGPWEVAGIWGARHVPEGICFSDDTLEPDKAQRISDIEDARRDARVERLGYWVQPV